MGEASRRRRRGCTCDPGPRSTEKTGGIPMAHDAACPTQPEYAAQVPQREAVYLGKDIVEQAERRLPMTTFDRAEFFDKLVEAGIAWFDMEMDNLSKAKAQPPADENLIQPATHIPKGMAEASVMLQELKRGTRAAEVVSSGPR